MQILFRSTAVIETPCYALLCAGLLLFNEMLENSCSVLYLVLEHPLKFCQ